MKKISINVTFVFLLFSILLFSEEKIFKADFRSRPPEMVIDKDNNLSGPLKDILDEAAENIGYKIKWRIAPFKRSLEELKNCGIDIIPRTLRTEEREKFINYIGPIGIQKKDILFLVKKGKENLINDYNDLKKIKIAVKRGTVYFEKFDKDTSIKKIISKDDKNMAKMFIYNRFDTMIVLDKSAIESELNNLNFSDFSYANYKYENIIGNYYGVSKSNTNKKSYNILNDELIKMVNSGKINTIYEKYNIEAPSH